MRRLRYAIYPVVAALALAAIAACYPAPGSETTPTPETITVLPGNRLVLRPDPIPGPPEANPQIEILIDVRDAVTKKPVIASTVRLNGEIIARNVTEIRIRLPGRLTERYVELVIETPGYERAEYGFRWNLKHSRRFRLTAHLARRD